MILLRHGQSEFNVVYGATRKDPGIEDPALTEIGRAQASEAGRHLARLDIRHVIVSPYRRALETAELAVAELSVSVQIEPLVRERAAFSCDVGTPKSALQAHWPHHDFDHLEEIWWEREEESEAAVHRRGTVFCGQMVEAPGWRHTAVITHWGFIRAVTGLPVGNGALVRHDPSGREQPVSLVPASEA